MIKFICPTFEGQKYRVIEKWVKFNGFKCVFDQIWRFFLVWLELFNMNAFWANYHSKVFCYTRIKIHILQYYRKKKIQYCFICSSPYSTNLETLVQATISKYYICKVWKLSDEYFLHDIHFKSSSFPQFCVQSYGRLTHRRLTHRLHPYHNLHFDA